MVTLSIYWVVRTPRVINQLTLRPEHWTHILFSSSGWVPPMSPNNDTVTTLDLKQAFDHVWPATAILMMIQQGFDNCLGGRGVLPLGEPTAFSTSCGQCPTSRCKNPWSLPQGCPICYPGDSSLVKPSGRADSQSFPGGHSRDLNGWQDFCSYSSISYYQRHLGPAMSLPEFGLVEV